MAIAILGIEYDEPDISTYNGVSIYVNNDVEKSETINTGNLVVDWAKALKTLLDENVYEKIICSSSVDHFIVDDLEGIYEFDEETFLFKKVRP